MIDEIIVNSPALFLQNRRLKRKLTQDERILYSMIDLYLASYIGFNASSAEDACKSVNRFCERYEADLNIYIDAGTYPCQGTHNSIELSRTDYDLFLIASCLFTQHRFQIMRQLVSNLALTFNRVLSIGIGSGLELELIKGNCQSVDAYDVSISDFAKHHHSEVIFHEQLFRGSGKLYNAIIALELLEHLSEPYDLLELFFDSLEKRGVVVCTTAKNVPQFDHLYNFVDQKDFEAKVRHIGFSLEQTTVIPHNYHFYNIDANNVFYILRKH